MYRFAPSVIVSEKTQISNEDRLNQEHQLMKRIEIVQAKQQIEVLASFLPDVILNTKQNKHESRQNYVAVVLKGTFYNINTLVDKYNKIGKGGIYRLIATINAYLGSVIEIVYIYGGDVLNFSTDNILVQWKLKPNECLVDVLHKAVTCSLLIQNKLGNFKTEINVDITMKLTISCGNLTFSTLGNFMGRNFGVAGECFKDLNLCHNDCLPEMVGITPTAWEYMFKKKYEIDEVTKDCIRVVQIFYKLEEDESRKLYEEKFAKSANVIEIHKQYKDYIHSQLKYDTNLSDAKHYSAFLKSLTKRASINTAIRQWFINDLRTYILKPVNIQIDESQPVKYLTETRNLTIQLVNIVHTLPCGVQLLDLADQVYNVVWKIVNNTGFIQSINIFDEIINILVIFGMDNVINEMESMQALNMSGTIRKDLLNLSGVTSVTIIVTKNFVFCGVFGHPFRQEFLITGGVVNETLRLLKLYRDSIFCDYKTYKKSNFSSFYFRATTLNKYMSNDQVFEFCDTFENKSNIINAPSISIGRYVEYELITSILNGKVDRYIGVCIHGPLNLETTSIIRTLIDLYRKDHRTVISLELEESMNIPYFCVENIYKQLYDIAAKIESNIRISLPNLPRYIYEYKDYIRRDREEDLVWKKYEILNDFRDMTSLFSDPVIIFIDNAEYIDQQSWSILDITLRDNNIRLVLGANFETTNWDLKFQISVNDQIKLHKLPGIQENLIPVLACEYTNVDGMPKELANLLVLTCQGQKDLLEYCLLKLVNNRSLRINEISKFSKIINNYVFCQPKEEKNVYTVLDFTETYKEKTNFAALSAIAVFEVFLPFEKLVIKTAAALGEIFSRSLLVIALKYPSDFTLAKTIKVLFEKNIFDCGSRYICPGQIETSKLCCKCYFDESYFTTEKYKLPRYAYCKTLHFCNKSIREIAYTILPDSQKKELHVLCTEILENSNNQCPSCRRNPAQSFLPMETFKNIVALSQKGIQPHHSTQCEYIQSDNLREIIKRAFLYNQTQIEKETVDLRKIECNCVEINLRLLRSLIYHSKRANDILKRIFFTTQYGLLLIYLRDVVNGYQFLNAARELCFKDISLPNCSVSEIFRRLHVGRIEMGLAKACIDAQNINEAQCHLAIALRQYNIPSITLSYKHFNKLLSRSFIQNRHNFLMLFTKNKIFRKDLGYCLILCSKLFVLKRKWKMAKFSSMHSIFILKGININTSLLVESYCTVMDIFKCCSDNYTCIKLQKFMVQELQINYCHDLTTNLELLCTLGESFVDIKSMSGEISAAIRLAYRLLDVYAKVSSGFISFGILIWLKNLLYLKFRIVEAVNVCQLLQNSHSRVRGHNTTLLYQMNNLFLYLYSGFIYGTINNTIKYCKYHFNRKTCNYNWNDIGLRAALALHFMRLKQYEKAKSWYVSVTFDEIVLKQSYVLRIFFTFLEIKILEFIRCKSLDDPNYEADKRFIKKWFKMMETEVKNGCKILQPYYYIYYAWYCRINKKVRKSEKLIKRAVKVAETQGNIMHRCLALRQQSAWKGGNSFKYSERPVVWYHHAGNFSENDLIQFLHPFPLE